MAESHDQIFKDLIRAFPRAFLNLAAPDFRDQLDLATLEIQPTESFLDLPRGKERRLDWLARADGPGGERVLLHVEIELRYRRAAAERLWRYNRLAHQRHGLPVHSFVLNLRGGPGGIRRRRHRELSLGREVCTFRYTSLGLSAASAERFLARRNPIAWALAALMRWPEDLRPAERRIRCLRRIARARALSETQRFLLFNVVVTYLRLDEASAAEYEALLAETRHRKERKMVMTWADQMEAKGERVGLQKGMREVVLRQLGKRFSPLPAGVVDRLARIESPEELGRLAERLLEVRTLAELGLAD
jgi:predicted transposase YdaD